MIFVVVVVQTSGSLSRFGLTLHVFLLQFMVMGKNYRDEDKKPFANFLRSLRRGSRLSVFGETNEQ